MLFMSTFGHSIFTACPVDSFLFTVRKYNFFRRILELSRPIFQKNLNFKKFWHRAVLFPSNEYSFFFLHSDRSSSENAHTVSPLQPCCLLQELIYEKYIICMLLCLCFRKNHSQVFFSFIMKTCKFIKDTGVSCAYCKIFRNSFFVEHLWWLLLWLLSEELQDNPSWHTIFQEYLLSAPSVVQCLGHPGNI